MDKQKEKKAQAFLRFFRSVAFLEMEEAERAGVLGRAAKEIEACITSPSGESESLLSQLCNGNIEEESLVRLEELCGLRENTPLRT
ncbi:MAG: hypothetical protein ABH833_02785 [Parcubacteria group bacterium]